MTGPLATITVKVLHSTDKAYLVTEDDERKVWLPVSQCEIEMISGTTAELTAPEWLLMEKELI